jgi:glucosylceramidase
MYWTEGGPEITDPAYAVDWARWSKTSCEILKNGLRCIIGWNLALDENGKPNIGPFHCGGLVTIHSGSGEVTRSGQYWAFTHYARAFRRSANVIQSDGEIKGVHHVAAENLDGSYAAVLTNTGPARRTVWVRRGKSVVEVPLPEDSVVTLAWS